MACTSTMLCEADAARRFHRRFLCTGGSDASVAIIDVKDLIALHYLHCDGEIADISVSFDACWVAFCEWSSGNVTNSGISIASSKTGASCDLFADSMLPDPLMRLWTLLLLQLPVHCVPTIAGRVQRIDMRHPVSSSSWNPNTNMLAFVGGTAYDSRGDAFGPVCICAGPGR